MTNPAPVRKVGIDETFISDDYLTVNWPAALGDVNYYELSIFNTESNIQNINERIIYDIVEHLKPPRQGSTTTKTLLIYIFFNCSQNFVLKFSPKLCSEIFAKILF